jgi:hypothetical protein
MNDDRTYDALSKSKKLFVRLTEGGDDTEDGFRDAARQE